jgi:hypothetical protein
MLPRAYGSFKYFVWQYFNIQKERQILDSCYRDTRLAKTGLYAIMNALFLASAINELKIQYVFKL